MLVQRLSQIKFDRSGKLLTKENTVVIIDDKIMGQVYFGRAKFLLNKDGNEIESWDQLHSLDYIVVIC